MISFSSGHMPYIIAAFSFTGCVLVTLTYWTLQADRKARLQLKKREALEVIFHKRGS